MDCGKKINIPGTGEHHCSNQQKSQLPTLCSSTSSYSNDSSDDDQPSESLYTTKKLPKIPEKPVENGIWSFFRSNHVKPVEQRMDDEPSVYYDTYTAQLSAAKINPRRASRVRENEKWKDLTDEKSKYNIRLFAENNH
jgi:hypothetical protein